MRAAKIVYLLLTILLLLPVLIFNGKKIIKYRKETGDFSVKRIVLTIVAVCLIIFLTVNLYSFTINYQSPLVAERVGGIFTRGLAGEFDVEDYGDQLAELGLLSDTSQLIGSEDIQFYEIKTGEYSLGISQRSYREGEDQEVFYLSHGRGSMVYYSYLKLSLEDNTWKVSDHTFLTLEEIETIQDDLGHSIRYYDIEL